MQNPEDRGINRIIREIQNYKPRIELLLEKEVTFWNYSLLDVIHKTEREFSELKQADAPNINNGRLIPALRRMYNEERYLRDEYKTPADPKGTIFVEYWRMQIQLGANDEKFNQGKSLEDIALYLLILFKNAQ